MNVLSGVNDVEIFIAIFLGAWVSIAGIASYHTIKKDFDRIEKEKKGSKK